ncbi:hypothetical protein RKD28_007182 [Streptomyces sp. SAI-229]
MRQVPASVDGRAFTPATALRPGEQVQVDTTRLDVLALFDDGRLARPELTIAVDVATRAILAAVLCPSATKAVDAALLLAEMAVPHPTRPTWPNTHNTPGQPPPRTPTSPPSSVNSSAVGGDFVETIQGARTTSGVPVVQLMHRSRREIRQPSGVRTTSSS